MAQPYPIPSIRKGDTVRVISGRDRGKTGRVLSVEAGKRRLFVEHANMIKRHTRPNPAKNIKGGIVEREGPMAMANVMLVCAGCNKPTRIGHQVLADGTRVRVCRRCGTTFGK